MQNNKITVENSAIESFKALTVILKINVKVTNYFEVKMFTFF